MRMRRVEERAYFGKSQYLVSDFVWLILIGWVKISENFKKSSFWGVRSRVRGFSWKIKKRSFWGVRMRRAEERANFGKSQCVTSEGVIKL